MNDFRPDLETLVRFAINDCDPIRLAQVQRWLDANAGRRPEMDRVLLMVDALRTNQSIDAPREVVRRAVDLMVAAFPNDAAGAWWDTLQSVVATLLFDGRVSPMIAGYRGVGTPGHVVYATDFAELDLELSESTGDEGGIMVRGQVQSDGASGKELRFVPSTDPARSTTVIPDEHGLFRAALLPGTYTIHCRVGEQAMTIPEIRIE